jgi:hypothetical protein
MPSNATTRHAVARSTGATTLATKAEEGWTLVCLNHGTENPQPSRGAVWKADVQPEAWCPKCTLIAAGKAEKITDGPLPIPTKKAAPKKSATRRRRRPRAGGVMPTRRPLKKMEDPDSGKRMPVDRA